MLLLCDDADDGADTALAHLPQSPLLNMDEESISVENLRRMRRESTVGTMSAEKMRLAIASMPMTAIKRKGFKNASMADLVDLVQSFKAALMNCSTNVDEDIGMWFDRR